MSYTGPVAMNAASIWAPSESGGTSYLGHASPSLSGSLFRDSAKGALVGQAQVAARAANDRWRTGGKMA